MDRMRRVKLFLEITNKLRTVVENHLVMMQIDDLKNLDFAIVLFTDHNDENYPPETNQMVKEAFKKLCSSLPAQGHTLTFNKLDDNEKIKSGLIGYLEEIWAESLEDLYKLFTTLKDDEETVFFTKLTQLLM